LAEMGDVHEILIEIEALRSTSPELAEQLYQFADNFDTDSIAELMKQHLD